MATFQDKLAQAKFVVVTQGSFVGRSSQSPFFGSIGWRGGGTPQTKQTEKLKGATR